MSDYDDDPFPPLRQEDRPADGATTSVVEATGDAVAARLAANPAVLELAKQCRVSVEEIGGTLKNTIFPVRNQARTATVAELIAFCVVAAEHRLNPFLREIFAFPSKDGGIVPIVSVDGWFKIMNRHPDFDGFTQREVTRKTADVGGIGIETTLYHKRRQHPIVHTEWMSECNRGSGPWQKTPMRMLANRSLSQTVRIALGIAGIYTQDEAEVFADAAYVEHEVVPDKETGKSIDLAALAPHRGGGIAKPATKENQ